MHLFTDALSLNILIIIGICIVARFLYSSIVFFKKTIYLYLISKNRLNPKKYGEWSVVTGATNGIGNCFAELLAKRGSNLVIIGRNEDALSKMKSNLESTFKVQIKTIVKDYTNEDYSDIKKICENLDIGILVNNVGMAVSVGKELCNLADDDFNNLIKANILSCCMMTRIILPDMIKRRKGVVVNIASITSYYPLRYFGIYPSTKDFINFFTETLIREYPFDKFGIYFNSINPSFVSTKMTKMKTSFLVPSANDYAYSALDTFEYTGKTNGCLIHHLIATVVTLMPIHLLDVLVRKYTLQMKEKYDNWKRKAN